MNLSEAKHIFFTQLEQSYDNDELRAIFNIVCEKTFGLDRVEIPLNLNKIIEDKGQKEFTKVIDQLKSHQPIQYIYGVADFYNLKINVTPDVLIPRPETEELVDIIVKSNDQPFLKILDIGTGSGCIAISLAKNISNSKVSAIDFSEKALEIAKKNAQLNSVTIDFIHKDILNTGKLPHKYDIIVSNPPYVKDSEKKNMHKNVLDYEPHTALYVRDENPLVFYDKIANLAYNHLNNNGKLYFEINQSLGEETKELVKSKGFSKVKRLSDFKGNHRFVLAYR